MQRQTITTNWTVGLLLFGVWASPALAENYALLIGINDYPHARQLRGAVNDIQQVRRLLVEDLKLPEAHIRVLLNEQATKANILKALESLAKQTRAGDTLFWYYSGHGWVQKDEDGDEALLDPDDRLDEVLVPYDAVPWPRERALDANHTMLVDDEISQALARMLGRRMVVVFDSCHSGTATRGLPGEDRTRSLYEGYSLPATPKTKSLKRPLETLDIGGQTVFVAASSPIQAASDLGEFDGKRHGAFTAGLLRSIQKLGPNWQRSVSWEELFRSARQDMINHGFATQTPSITAGDGLGKLPIEQLFNPPAAGEMAVLQSVGAFEVQLASNKYHFEEGELLELAVESARDGYLYIFDINAEQAVTQLLPNRFSPENRIRAGVPRQIPGNQERYQFRAGKPFGRSTVVAIVTTAPWRQADRLQLPTSFQPFSELQKNRLRDSLRILQDTARTRSIGGATGAEPEWSSQRVVVQIIPKRVSEAGFRPPAVGSAEPAKPSVLLAPPVAATVPPVAPSGPGATSPALPSSALADEMNLTPEMLAELPKARPELYAKLERLAERFSPVFWQDVSSEFDSQFRPWKDFFVRYDFDQTEQGPNWPEPPKFQDENKRARNRSLDSLLLPSPQRRVISLKESPGIYRIEDKPSGATFQLDLRPVVYWTVLTTPTHYFFHYVVFHAEDWKMLFGHTGDLEGTTVVVERQSEKMAAAFTLAHDDVDVVRSLDDEPEPNIGVLVNPALEARGLFDGEDNRPVDGSLGMEVGRDGEPAPKEHQDIYIETRGHGHHGPHKIKKSRYILYANFFAEETFTAPSFDKGKYPLTNRFGEVLSKHKYKLVYIGSGSGGRSADERSLWGEYGSVPRFPGGVNPPWDWRDNLFFKTGWWKDPRMIKKIGDERYLINPYLVPGRK